MLSIANAAKYNRYARNLSARFDNARFLDSFVKLGIPFALYPRGLDREDHVANILPHDSPDDQHEIDRREQALLGELAKSIPTFCFANYRDMNQSPIALRINLVGGDWQILFAQRAAQARLLIISTDRMGSGLKYELEWIEHNRAWDRTLLALSDDLAKELSTTYPDSASLGYVTGQSGAVPDQLKAVLLECERQIADVLEHRRPGLGP
jgi:hypothetical protein